MSQNQDVKPVVDAEAQAQLEALLAEAGIVKKPAKSELTPKQKAERIIALEAALQLAKEQKEEKLAKKIRRQMRALGFKRSEHTRIVLPVIEG